MVLKEYIVRFSAMLESAIKIDAQNKMEWINIVSVPHMKKDGGKKIFKQYQKLLDGNEPPDAATIKRDREALLRKLRGRS